MQQAHNNGLPGKGKENVKKGRNIMDSSAQCDLSEECKTGSKSASCSCSESSSTEEEERLRRLFQTCDRDGDGFIDRSVQTLFHS